MQAFDAASAKPRFICLFENPARLSPARLPVNF